MGGRVKFEDFPAPVAWWWDDCETKDCQAKCCRAIRSQFCFPHTVENISNRHKAIRSEEIAAVIRSLIMFNNGLVR